jgi:hypothetical protein
MQASLSIALVREGPPFPPAPGVEALSVQCPIMNGELPVSYLSLSALGIGGATGLSPTTTSVAQSPNQIEGLKGRIRALDRRKGRVDTCQHSKQPNRASLDPESSAHHYLTSPLPMKRPKHRLSRGPSFQHPEWPVFGQDSGSRM